MKKSTIWLLAAVMAVTFFGLLSLQINYFRASLNMRNDQFDEAVRRSLYQVSKNLELEQTRKYLYQEASDFYNKKGIYKDIPVTNANGEQIVTHSQSFRITDNNGDPIMNMEYNVSQTTSIKSSKSKNIPKRGTNAVAQASFNIQEQFKQRYDYQRQLVDNVIAKDNVISKLIQRSSTEPISEKINFKTLNNTIKDELKSNGIEIPFQFEIVDNNDKPIFKQENYTEPDKNSLYKQVLYPNDPIDKLNSLWVSFPTKNDYLLSEISLLLPAFVFTLILLITFIISIYLIFRQKRLSEMKSDFMNNMTHELKTPVSTVMAAVEAIQLYGVREDKEKMDRYLDISKRELEHLSGMIEKVLQMDIDASRGIVLQRSDFDIVAMVTSALEVAQLNKTKTVEAELLADPETILIKGDESHLKNVINNLLENAIKYAGPHVKIKVEIKGGKEQVQIRITDNGKGIAPEYHQQIFDMFFRVPSGNLHDVKGFGLGLAYVKQVVKRHEGKISVDSELEKGSTFIIRLPC